MALSTQKPFGSYQFGNYSKFILSKISFYWGDD